MNGARGTIMAVLMLILCGCASWVPHAGLKQNASVVDYLYPDATQSPQLKETVTYLRPPVRVGIAFVPGAGWTSGLPETERMKLLERVKASFAGHDYIGAIELIPGNYLKPKGGFANLEQVARMFNVEVVALLSHDQVQFNDTNALSVLYWTIIGAYFIHGDRYDIQTMVDASVFDVHSRKLLFRAPGASQIKGSSSMAGFSERSRQARTDGFNAAVDQLIPALQAELQGFKERIRSSTAYRIENKPGYRGGGAYGWAELLLVLVIAGAARARLRTT